MPESRTLSGSGSARSDAVAKMRHMGSPQSLSESDRRIVAAWAASCAERVLALFEAQAPGDGRPRDAIARTRAFARGELGVADAIRRRFVGGGAARDVRAPAAAAAARAAGQATAVAHMGAHALGAAAYAAKAAGLAAPDRQVAVGQEIRWQLGHMSPPVRAALRRLPPVASNSSGPLGPGLLASGLLGTIIHDLQAALADRASIAARPHTWHVQPIARDAGSGRRSQAETRDATGAACPVEADPEPRDSRSDTPPSAGSECRVHAEAEAALA